MKYLCKSGLALFLSCVILLVGFSAFALCDPKTDTYCNPLGETLDIVALIQSILGSLLKITLPLAGLGIIIAGLNYVAAAATGNSGRTQSAKKTFTYVLIGSFIVVGANALALAIIGFFTGLG